MTMTITTVNYDSAGDYVAAMCDETRQPIGAGRCAASHDAGRRDFFWTGSWNEAVELSRCGWPEGTARVAKHRDSMEGFIAAAKQAKARIPGWDFTGDWLDVGRYMSGEQECWGIEIASGESMQSKVVSIRLNNCVSACISADTIAARGVAVLVATDLLEACGHRVEIIVGTATKAGNTLVESNVMVKRAGEQVDPDGIAFNVAHPSFFRRFGFRFMEFHGHSPSGCLPCPMSDCGNRDGVIEIDEILSGVRLDEAAMRQTVLSIAAKCGLTFDSDALAELIRGN